MARRGGGGLSPSAKTPAEKRPRGRPFTPRSMLDTMANRASPNILLTQVSRAVSMCIFIFRAKFQSVFLFFRRKNASCASATRTPCFSDTPMTFFVTPRKRSPGLRATRCVSCRVFACAWCMRCAISTPVPSRAAPFSATPRGFYTRRCKTLPPARRDAALHAPRRVAPKSDAAPRLIADCEHRTNTEKTAKPHE